MPHQVRQENLHAELQDMARQADIDDAGIIRVVPLAPHGLTDEVVEDAIKQSTAKGTPARAGHSDEHIAYAPNPLDPRLRRLFRPGTLAALHVAPFILWCMQILLGAAPRGSRVKVKVIKVFPPSFDGREYLATIFT